MPLRINHALGALIGRFFYLFEGKVKRITHKNIALCFPNLDKNQRETLIKKSLIEAGKSLTESSFIWLNDFQTNQKSIVKTIGAQHLNTSDAIILLVPHFGCWEITGRVLSLLKPTTFLYKPPKKIRQANFLIKTRQQGNLLMASTDKKGVIKLQRAIQNRELIGILPDQNPGTQGSVLSPFFNQNIPTMTLLVRLARKHNAKVLMTWAKRLDKGVGYELNLELINVLSKSGTIEADVALMNQAIENLIKTQPEQYLWSYKRFKSVIKY